MKTKNYKNEKGKSPTQWIRLMLAFVAILLIGVTKNTNAQPWTYDFGTGTGTHTSSTASTTFLPTPTSGIARVRVGTNPGSIVMANPGLASFGTNTELQITSNTSSTSTTKFSIYDYTASKVGYVKYSIVLNGGTNGVYNFTIGDGATFSDNNAMSTAQIFAGVQWTLGASNAITYRVLNNATWGTTGITNSTTLFSQSTSNIYIVEVYYNNTAASVDYTRSGTTYSLTSDTWDLWVNEVREGTNLASGGISNNVNIDSYTFNHQVSATAPGTIYLDDIEYSNALPVTCSAPTTQANTLTFSSVASSSMTVNWTNGDGSKRIVIMNTANSFTNPTDGTDPVANTVYGGSGEQVVYNGNSNTVNITGLSASTTYWFRVYEYNCTGASTVYMTSTATDNPLSQATTAACATNPTITTTVAASSITSTTASSGGQTLSSGAGCSITNKGVCWNTSTGPTIANSKTDDGTGTADFTSSLTGLSPATLYYARAYVTNSFGTNYGNEITFRTLSTEPSTHPGSFTAAPASTSSIDLTFSAASTITNAYGYIILQRQGANPTGTPTDATGYNVGDAIGDGTVAAIITNTATTSATISSLTANTQYNYSIIPFNYDGTNAATYNYRTAATIKTANATTFANAPSTQASLITFSSVGSSSMTVNWTNGDGARRIVIMNTSNSFTNPTNGSDPTADNSWNNAGEQTIYNNTGGSVTVTGLSATTTYWFRVYEYNNTGVNTLYITSTATDNPLSQATTLTPISIAYQGFEVDPATPADDWNYSGGTTTESTTAFYSGAQSLRIEGSSTVTFDNITTLSAYNSIVLSVAFSSTGVDSGEDLFMDISYDGGSTWTGTGSVQLVDGYSNANIAFGATNGSDPTTVASNPWTVNVSESETQIAVRFRTVGLDAGEYYYIDEVKLTGVMACTSPLTQATSFSTNTITSTSMNIAFTRGNGDNVMVVCKAGSAPTDPTSGTTYATNATYGSGDPCGGGFVVYNGSAAGSSNPTGNIAILGLTAGVTYYFAVYEYNNVDVCYNMTELTGNATAIFPEPSNHVTAFTCGSTGPYNIPLTWTDAIGASIPTGYLIKWSTVSYADITSPVDGSATADGAGAKNVAAGVQSANITGLSVSTTYYFKIFPYTNSGTSIDYKTDGTVPTSSCITKSTPCLTEDFEGATYPPTDWSNGGTAKNTSATCDGTNQIEFNATGDYIVTPPIDNPSVLIFQYKRTSSGVAWSFKVQKGSSSSGPWTDVTTISDATTSCQTANVDVSAYISETNVYFRFLDTRASGIEERYIDDFNVICSACGTPTSVSTGITFSNIIGTGLRISWANGNGANRIVVARAVNPVTFIPSDLTTYTANTVFGAGADLGSGEYCVYNGSGSSVDITNLTSNTLYHFAIYEYNCTAANELYYSTPATASQGTTNYVSTGTIVGSPFCVTSTSSTAVSVPFTYSSVGSFPTATFTAQLSNSTGSFDSPITIGTIASDGSGSQSISANIPANTTSGTAYRIRVISTDPDITGSDNAVNISISNSPENVVFNAPSEESGQVVITWNAPTTGCFDNYYLVVVSTSTISGTPTGDGSAYTADPNFGGSGTSFGVGKVVFKGANASLTVTGLTNGTTYYVRTYTRWGTNWSTGTEITVTPNATTVLSYGDLAIVAINTNASGDADDKDEMSFVCFKNILPGTAIDITDNGYERLYAGEWADSEGFLTLTRKVTSTNIPAGTIITLYGANTPVALGSTFDVYVNGVLDNANWNLTGSGPFNLNINDQVWFLQSGTWTNPAGSHNATYSGNVLYGWTATGWKTEPGYDDTKGSTVPTGIECSKTDVQDKFFPDRVKYNGATTPANKIEWIGRLNDSPNWDDYNDNASYQVATPLYKTVGATFSILSGNLETAGKWAGYSSGNWCDCANWKSLTIPTSSTDVIIPVSSTHVIDLSEADSTAKCNNLTVYGTIKGEGSSCKLLHVYGNIDIKSTGLLDFDDSDNLTPDDSIIVDGNWTSTGHDRFSEGNSTVVFTAAKIINTTGGEVFYNITKAGVQNSLSFNCNVTINGVLDLSPGNVLFRGRTLTLNGTVSGTGSFLASLSTDVISNFSYLVIGGTNGGALGTMRFSATYSYVRDITINRTGASASVTLGSNINATRNLTLTSGVLNTGSYSIDLGANGSLVETALNPSSYVNGNIKATRNIGGGINQTFGGLGLEINEPGAANSTVATRVTGTALVGNSPDNNPSILRYFDIVPTTNTGLNATMIFHYFDNELNSLDESDFVLFKANLPYVADSWTTQDVNNTLDIANNKITITGVTGFSRWTVAKKSLPLPIELLSFNGLMNNGNVEFEWLTASEINNHYFTLERSNDAVNFNNLLIVPGAGNSKQVLKYSAVDNNPFKGIAYYRLKQTDYNGKYSYSNIIKIDNNNKINFAIGSIYSNGNNINVNITTDDLSPLLIEIIDVEGRIIEKQIITPYSNNSNIELTPFTPLKGVNMIRITHSKGVEVKKFIK